MGYAARTVILYSLLSILGAPASAQTCGSGVLCPAAAPCCQLNGLCGTGPYCLGGCNPTNSFDLGSCVPEPSCKAATYTFDNLNGITNVGSYLGDASTSDWTVRGQPLISNGQLLLTYAPVTAGTVIDTTHYIWYGRITATIKTSGGAGVVTEFILLSDSADELDFEFVGTDLNTAQTDYYSQGVVNRSNRQDVPVQDTFNNFHAYEFNWQPDTLTWSIDGQVVRTLNRADTFDAAANRYRYPQTPARVQFAITDANGQNGEVPVADAGGAINFDDQSFQANGYYYATVDTVAIECYSPPAGANVQGSASYIYTDRAATNQSVEVTDDIVVLTCTAGTGDNPSCNSASSSSTTSTTTSATSSTSTSVSTSSSSSRSSTSTTTLTTSPAGSSTATVNASTTPTTFSSAPSSTTTSASTTTPKFSSTSSTSSISTSNTDSTASLSTSNTSLTSLSSSSYTSSSTLSSTLISSTSTGSTSSSSMYSSSTKSTSSTSSTTSSSASSTKSTYSTSASSYTRTNSSSTAPSTIVSASPSSSHPSSTTTASTSRSSPSSASYPNGHWSDWSASPSATWSTRAGVSISSIKSNTSVTTTAVADTTTGVTFATTSKPWLTGSPGRGGDDDDGHQDGEDETPVTACGTHYDGELGKRWW